MNIPSYVYTSEVCEVEIDPETGLVEVVNYSSVDDCGRAVNPLLIHGQSHGGIAQGIGQALFEECVYDRDTAQLLSGSLMDYALPRADILPLFRTEISEVPSTTNPLGMRGGSEGGITPGLAAVSNAIVDALTEFGSSTSTCRRRRSGFGVRSGPRPRRHASSPMIGCSGRSHYSRSTRQQGNPLSDALWRNSAVEAMDRLKKANITTH